MTVSEARQELRQYRQECTYLRKKREDIDRLKSRLTNMNMRIRYMPGGKNPRAFEDAANILADAELEHEAMFAAAELERLTVERKINRMPHPYKSVLYLRYMRGLNWREISDELGYDEDYVSRDRYGKRSATGIHGTALRMYAEL